MLPTVGVRARSLPLRELMAVLRRVCGTRVSRRLPRVTAVVSGTSPTRRDVGEGQMGSLSVLRAPSRPDRRLRSESTTLYRDRTRDIHDVTRSRLGWSRVRSGSRSGVGRSGRRCTGRTVDVQTGGRDRSDHRWYKS